MVDFIIGLLNVMMVLGSLFLICIILIQRGKGGGLAGAFGGVGGSSAFGTKAGDVFTKITIGVAAGWILAAMILVVLTNGRHHSAFDSDVPTSVTKELSSSSAKSKTKSAASDLGAGEVPPPIPIPATGAPLSTPPLESPGNPRHPGDRPDRRPDRPRRRHPPSRLRHLHRLSTPTPAPAKPASTPK